MLTRRVITGHRDGKAVFISDGASGKRLESSVPPAGAELIWTTDATPPGVPAAADTVGVNTRYVPNPGATSFFVICLPPDDSFQAFPDETATFWQNSAAHMPELIERMEPDAPGMHRTETIDYVVVLDNAITLELDDGQATVLSAGDVVVQTGTRHAWRNHTAHSTRLAVTMVGAIRS